MTVHCDQLLFIGHHFLKQISFSELFTVLTEDNVNCVNHNHTNAVWSIKCSKEGKMGNNDKSIRIETGYE